MAVKMLFVDDEPKLQAVIRQLFRREERANEYELLFVLDGHTALETLRTDPQIALLLTDLNMPKMSGLTLLSKVQALKPTLNPVLTAIVISAYGDMDNIRRAMNAGAFDFLTKPFDFEDMRLTIQKAIAHVKRLEAAQEQERQAKEALRRLNQKLEQRVEERTNELLKSNAELNAFAHTVAHDIKNPLGVITGHVDYALDYFDELDSQETLEILQNIRQYSYKVTNIVEELLLLAGVRKLDVPRLPVDMGQIVQRAQKRLFFMIKEADATIVVPDSWPMAKGYSPWLEEVWVNYISNGLKYGGPSPRLELGGEAGQDGIVRFWIRDEGKGISPLDQKELFTEFTRVTEQNPEGYGLGLSIVKRVIEKLGGEVGVDSQVGQGSEFYFTLPAADS